MIVNFPEFEQYKVQGYKGTFVGGCVERGEGSSFRRKAHAHCFGQDAHMGWICVRSPKRLYNKAGGASLLMWHEMAHIITHDGHGRKFYMWLREHSTIRKDEERTSQWAYLCRHYSDPVKAYDKIKGRTTRRSGMAKKQPNYGTAVAEAPAAAAVNEIDRLTGDTVKEMGPAKAGGRWFKNYHTGALYRIEKKGDALVVSEKRAGGVTPVVARKDRVAGISRATKKGDGTSRAALMAEVKAKGTKYYRVMNKAELEEVLKSGTSAKRIEEIQKQAVKRWKDGWNTKGKEKE
jgi:hypothetical protein